jgi:hypothetical protein
MKGVKSLLYLTFKIKKMKKLFILLLLAIVSIAVRAQTATFALKTINDYTWNSNYTLTNAVADTFIINAPRNYPATQSYSVNLDSASGNHTNVAVALYGSLLGTTYTQIGSTVNWKGTSVDTTITITNTTTNRYDYYKIIITGTGTGTTTIDWQKFRIWTANGTNVVPLANTDGSETLTASQSGTTVVCSYAGATTITIPDPSASTVGVVYYVVQTADQNLVVTATTANGNSIVCDGVATSDNVTISTASHKIGSGMVIIGISSTQWYVGGLNPESLLTPEAAD